MNVYSFETEVKDIALHHTHTAVFNSKKSVTWIKKKESVCFAINYCTHTTCCSHICIRIRADINFYFVDLALSHFNIMRVESAQSNKLKIKKKKLFLLNRSEKFGRYTTYTPHTNKTHTDSCCCFCFFFFCLFCLNAERSHRLSDANASLDVIIFTYILDRMDEDVNAGYALNFNHSPSVLSPSGWRLYLFQISVLPWGKSANCSIYFFRLYIECCLSAVGK